MRLYHYLPENHGLDDLKNKRLKIARIEDLNDPFELCVLANEIRSSVKHFETLSWP